MIRDLKSNIATVQLLDPVDAVTTDVASKWLDLKDFSGAALSLLMGAFTGVDGSNYLTPVLQHSDTTADSDAAAVAAADIVGAFTVVNSTSKDACVQTVGYIGKKRYVRVKLDYTGTGISASLVAVLGVLGLPDIKPATAPDAVAAT